MNILVTGASGMVGQRFVELTRQQTDHRIYTTSRNADNQSPSQIPLDLERSFNIEPQLKGIDVIVHCAARVHQMNETVQQAQSAYKQVNTDATLALAQQAANSGVKRFVFLSSIKVNGEGTNKGQAYVEDENPSEAQNQNAISTNDPYGKSKLEAEQGLLKLGKTSNMEVVIIRPPLVYGPTVKANFAMLIKLMSLPALVTLFLPLGAINNLRSYVYIDNLIDFITLCCTAPKAVNEVYLVSDDHDISTTGLLKSLAKAMNKKGWLLPVPTSWIVALANMAGKKPITDRLCGSLQLDVSKAKNDLNWQPKYTLEQGLRYTVQSKKIQTHHDNHNKRAIMIRLIDITCAFLGLWFGWPILLAIYIIGLFDTGSPIFKQERVGKNQQPFTLYKFRTMGVQTQSVATHKVDKASITKLGSFLRKTKLDELPQLINVLKGEMSLVGPRPGLFNQTDLTQARQARGIYKVRPGITGLAQINNIDMSTPERLAKFDQKMIQTLTITKYFQYILATVTGSGAGDKVK